MIDYDFHADVLLGSGSASGKYGWTTTPWGFFRMAGYGDGWACGEGDRGGDYGYGESAGDDGRRTGWHGSGYGDGFGLPDGTGRG